MNNVENLNKMADYFSGKFTQPFHMRQYCYCALGHSIRHLDNKENKSWDFNWVSGAARRLFGFGEGDAAGQFLFSSQWIDNPKACAARFRYVALHGDAPSSDQWNRFQFAPKPITIAPEVEEELAGV